MTGPVAINYSREVGWSGGVIAELCRGQTSTAIVTFNYDHLPEIGTYHATLSNEVFAQALAALRRSGYQQLSMPTAIAPDSKAIVLGERRDGEPLPTLRTFELRGLPPAIGALAQEIEGIIAKLRATRTRVIEASAAWTKPSFDPNEPLTIRVTLRNTGTVPLTLGSPLGAPPDEWCGLRLFLRDSQGEEQSVELRPAHLRPLAGAPTEPSVVLPPAAPLSFLVKKRVYLSPGHYAAAFSYRNMIAPPDDPQFVGGEISMALAPLPIQEESRTR